MIGIEAWQKIRGNRYLLTCVHTPAGFALPPLSSSSLLPLASSSAPSLISWRERGTQRKEWTVYHDADGNCTQLDTVSTELADNYRNHV